MTTRVAVIIGSLRKESYTRKAANALMAFAPAALRCSIVEIGDLALYNEDLENNDPPAAWSHFRSEIKASDAVLFATPEYNRSVPGCLKNAIDVGSRPYGKNTFDGLPAAVISVSPGKIGAFGANHALRQSCVFLNMPVMQQPEAYIGGASEMFDDKGHLVSEETRGFFKKFMTSFADWVERAGRKPD